MERVLVTGGAGFLGRHLMTRLRQESLEAVGVDVSRSADPSVRAISHATDALSDFVRRLEPDRIIHAAFVNRKPEEWSDAAYLARVAEVDTPLLDAAAEVDATITLVSSSSVYGNGGGERIHETARLEPVSLYGCAKALQEVVFQRWSRSHGIVLSTVRLFNLVGPGQRLGMLLPDWVSQVARAERSGAPPTLRVQTLSTARDFLDARDAADALVRITLDPEPASIVNVASGRAVPLTEVVDHLRRLATTDFDVEVINQVSRATDVTAQYGDPSRLVERWDWQPRFSLADSVRDVWREWLEQDPQ